MGENEYSWPGFVIKLRVFVFVEMLKLIVKDEGNK